MNQAITCPRCRNEFEITEVMRSQLTDQIRAEFESESADRRAELDAARKLLEEERLSVEAARERIDELVNAQIASQRENLIAKARREAAEELTLELSDRDQQMTELRKKLKTAQDTELQLRQRERELQAKAEELQLEVARQLDVEREKIRTEALQQSNQEHRLKDLEKEKQITDLRRQIDELKRKAEQGSQQLQGEVQEIALEETLRAAFPIDNISPVPKGVCGGDTLQQILDSTGLTCGAILWESKRTKNWSAAWLAKVRDDQRAARAACSIIVSEALPDGVSTFGLIDGVWVCSWKCVRPLATALRIGLIEVAKSRLAVQGQHDKMEMVYNYLSGQEFRSHVAGIVEAFVSMRSDLEAERRSMQRIWSKREKQIECALANSARMYGDLQGIIGVSLAGIEGLAGPRIELDEETQDKVQLLESRDA